MTMTLDDRLRMIPPQNLEAECSVLGGIMLDNEAINHVLDLLQAEDFYRESHRKIFRAMMELTDRSEPVDLVTLSDLLKSKGDLEAIGGTAYLASLQDLVPTAVNIGSYAQIVKEKAQKRKIIAILDDASAELWHECQTNSSDIAVNVISALSAIGSARNRFVDITESSVAAIREIETAYQRRNPVIGIPTGLTDLDQKVGGLGRSSLFVAAGRTSMGKTGLGITALLNAAQQGYEGAFVTIESPAKRIVTRMLSAMTGIENRRILRGVLTESEIPKLIAASGRLSGLPIKTLSAERLWQNIKASIRALKIMRPELSLVVLDYLQLIQAPIGRKDRRDLEIGHITGEAKALAMEFDLSILLLSQLNRAVENREDKRPRLADLRESGDIEQDADVVGLLYRPAYYDEQAPAELAELNIAKNREGATGVIPLRFQPETVSFSDAPR